MPISVPFISEWIENAIDQGQTNVLVANKQLVTAIRYKVCVWVWVGGQFASVLCTFPTAEMQSQVDLLYCDNCSGGTVDYHSRHNHWHLWSC